MSPHSHRTDLLLRREKCRMKLVLLARLPGRYNETRSKRECRASHDEASFINGSSHADAQSAGDRGSLGHRGDPDFTGCSRWLGRMRLVAGEVFTNPLPVSRVRCAGEFDQRLGGEGGRRMSMRNLKSAAIR
jgi:hypothetical protein